MQQIPRDVVVVCKLTKLDNPPPDRGVDEFGLLEGYKFSLLTETLESQSVDLIQPVVMMSSKRLCPRPLITSLTWPTPGSLRAQLMNQKQVPNFMVPYASIKGILKVSLLRHPLGPSLVSLGASCMLCS